jgi:hypothetical protein
MLKGGWMQRQTDSRRRGMPIFALTVALAWAFSYASGTVNYDTAWTYMYHGGKTARGKGVYDNLRDIRILPGGEALCLGQTGDSNSVAKALLIKLSADGKEVQKKIYGMPERLDGTSFLIASNGDYVFGGDRFGAPVLVRLDSAFNLKWSTWYYDSVANRNILARGASINAILETDAGRLVTVAGDFFPDNNGQNLGNYAAFLEFDAAGAVKRTNEWLDVTGFEVAGWSLARSPIGGYLIGGNQASFYVDSTGNLQTKNQYSFSLPGVGSEVNNVTRVRNLRDGRAIVIGQSYEEDCWTKYQRLYFDAWWSTATGTGSAGARHTAGVSGANDVVYDVTQLLDGNLAFVGKKQSFDQISGVWAFVTDSSGSEVLWEKQIRLPYQSEDGAAAGPNTVVATPDSGFTVVGRNQFPDSLGGMDAFVAHFVPKAGSATRISRRQDGIRCFQAGSAWAVAFSSPAGAEAELSLMGLDGKVVSITRTHAGPGQTVLHFDPRRIMAGLHVWRLKLDGVPRSGVVVF